MPKPAHLTPLQQAVIDECAKHGGVIRYEPPIDRTAPPSPIADKLLRKYDQIRSEDATAKERDDA